MRHQLNRLTRRKSTKSERKVSEILKRNKIPFKAKWKVQGYEVDFLIGKTILEIDGDIHGSINREREQKFLDAGYIPLHISVSQVYKGDDIEEDIIKLIK